MKKYVKASDTKETDITLGCVYDRVDGDYWDEDAITDTITSVFDKYGIGIESVDMYEYPDILTDDDGNPAFDNDDQDGVNITVWCNAEPSVINETLATELDSALSKIGYDTVWISATGLDYTGVAYR